MISPHIYPPSFEHILFLFPQAELTLGYNSQLTGFSSWDDDTVEGSWVHLSNLKYDRFGRAWGEEKETPVFQIPLFNFSDLGLGVVRPCSGGSHSHMVPLWTDLSPLSQEGSWAKMRRDGPMTKHKSNAGMRGRCQATQMSRILIPEMLPFL